MAYHTEYSDANSINTWIRQYTQVDTLAIDIHLNTTSHYIYITALDNTNNCIGHYSLPILQNNISHQYFTPRHYYTEILNTPHYYYEYNYTDITTLRHYITPLFHATLTPHFFSHYYFRHIDIIITLLHIITLHY
jgi:hypothetical protein